MDNAKINLDNKLNFFDIAGILVPNANRITENSIESFIMRVYRENNIEGFVKAFTEDPESISSSGKLEKVLKLLYVRRLYIYPRFHQVVINALSNTSSDNSVTR